MTTKAGAYLYSGMVKRNTMRTNLIRYKGEWQFNVRKDFILNPLLTPGAKTVYLALKSHCAPDADMAYPSAEYLAQCLGVGRDTIHRYVVELKKQGWITTCQHGARGRFSHTIYTVHDQPTPPQTEKAATVKSYTKTSQSEEDLPVSKEAKEDTNSVRALFSPAWKPNPASKEEQLAGIKAPESHEYPSQTEFEAFCAASEIEAVLEFRPALYCDLCRCKWRHWAARLNRWVLIRDWRKYVLGLAVKIEEARGG